MGSIGRGKKKYKTRENVGRREDEVQMIRNNGP